MKNTYLLLIVLTSFAISVNGQPDLSYYLPDSVEYDPAIPTPKSIIGHEVGEWHATHDKLVSYMYALDKASDRVSLEVTGYTHEGRPLLLLTITSPENHEDIDRIREQHVALTNPAQSTSLDTKSMPVVFYIGFSIHGNEASGTNASLLAAYHFAAAKGQMNTYLQNTVILFDPCYNPDGMQRFSGWVNSRKSKSISPDPNDSEHNEAWPGGRYNHYWFDLNRDWLVGQHPESQARIRSFHKWKPNVLTDHHEMGTDASFFFQPGVPSRMHPLTPKKNLELTSRMGQFHAKALDEIGSFYYTQEGYDDFYYGKGSTFPDVQGAIGILFEQASSRGHEQESINGVLKFPFTIRNQFTTALSSLDAINAMREDFLNYQRQFFKDAINEASRDPMKAFIFGSAQDPVRAMKLAEIIARQDISIYQNKSSQTVNGKNYPPGSSYVVPLNQPQYKFIKSMFEKRTQFEDSLFYDISSWTLPLAFGLEYDELKASPSLGDKVSEPKIAVGKRIGGKSEYAYVFDAYGYFTPRAIYRLLKQGYRIKVASNVFYHPDGKKFSQGSILVPVSGQDKNPDQLEYIVNQIVQEDGIDIYAFQTGLDYRGVSLGSRSFLPLKKPEIAMIVGTGIAPTDVGEIWHLLDTRFEIPVTLLPTDVLERASLDKYTTIIAPPTARGFYLSDGTKEKLKGWVQRGGVIIGFENALNWLSSAGLGKFEMKKKEDKKEPLPQRPYGDIDEYTGAQETSGAIFEAKVDLTHPLLYGYYTSLIPIFKGNNLFMEKAKGSYSNPIAFTATPLLSGYISKENYTLLKESAVAGVTSMGQGRIVGFTDNLCFRAFWFGSNKMLMNAIYYGPLIDSESAR
jgi:hypothetical protein